MFFSSIFLNATLCNPLCIWKGFDIQLLSLSNFVTLVLISIWNNVNGLIVINDPPFSFSYYTHPFEAPNQFCLYHRIINTWFRLPHVIVGSPDLYAFEKRLLSLDNLLFFHLTPSSSFNSESGTLLVRMCFTSFTFLIYFPSFFMHASDLNCE